MFVIPRPPQDQVINNHNFPYTWSLPPKALESHLETAGRQQLTGNQRGEEKKGTECTRELGSRTKSPWNRLEAEVRKNLGQKQSHRSPSRPSFQPKQEKPEPMQGQAKAALNGVCLPPPLGVYFSESSWWP